MAFELPALYAIINIDAHREPTQLAAALLRGGVTLIQLRNKALPDEEARAIARSVKAAAEARSREGAPVTLIINDRIDLCLEIGADGVHLGQEDQSPASARDRLGPEAIVGLSTHNREQIRNAPTAALTYLAAGPIFRSATKSGHAPLLGTAGLKAMADIAPLPVVAIGGINEENAPDVFLAGATSVAMIEALAKTADPAGLAARIEDARRAASTARRSEARQ